MRTPVNNDNSITSHMQNRGMQPLYTVDRFPGEDPEPDAPMAQAFGRQFSPETVRQIQDAYAQYVNGGGNSPYGSDIFQGGLHGGGSESGRPRPNRINGKAKRKARRNKMMKDRGAVRAKPAIGVIDDGMDREPDSDMDDTRSSGPIYGDGKPSLRSGEAKVQADPNARYRNEFQKLGEKQRPAMNGSQDKEAILAYFKKMGMK